jgi:hypothetical protein
MVEVVRRWTQASSGQTALAEAHPIASDPESGLSSLDKPLTAKSEERNYAAELLRLRGELQLKMHQTDLAESHFRESIALAQSSGAKSWELRSAVSLARLLRDIDRRDEARLMPAEIYNWFTEGFDTVDLKEARPC